VIIASSLPPASRGGADEALALSFIRRLLFAGRHSRLSIFFVAAVSAAHALQWLNDRIRRI
jgi:hypothetical protein